MPSLGFEEVQLHEEVGLFLSCCAHLCLENLSLLKNHVRFPYKFVETLTFSCKNTTTVNVKKIDILLRGKIHGCNIFDE